MTLLQVFDHVADSFASGLYLPSHDYRVRLATALTFDATVTTLAGLTYTEVAAANGYSSGGALLSNVAVAVANTRDAAFTADPTTVATASGGTIEARYALLVNDSVTDDPPLAVVDFEGIRVVQDGDPFTLTWPAAGLFRWIRV